MTEPGDLDIWTIYVHPLDFPTLFVVRRQVIRKGQILTDTKARFASTLEEARDLIPPGLYCVGRQIGDEPQIVESWL
jgi:hypothetical protein